MPSTQEEGADRSGPTPKLPGMVGYMIRKAQLAVFRDFLMTTEGLAITPAQFSLLTIVTERPGLKQIELSELLEVKRANMVTMLDVLETRGLIVRRVVQSDARSHAVAITPVGRTLLGKLDKMIATHEAKITRGLTPEERDQVKSLLGTIIDNCGPDES